MGSVQEGDAEAFARLYAQHCRLVRAYVARRVGAAAAAEVTSEVFLVAWRRWPDAEAAGLPWLYRTAQHAVSNHLRGKSRYDQAVAHLAAAARSSPDAAEPTADRAIAARALLSLSEQDRHVLLAVAWDGLSAGDLAASLGCSTATAHVRLHRARRRLDAAVRAQDAQPDATMERSR